MGSDQMWEGYELDIYSCGFFPIGSWFGDNCAYVLKATAIKWLYLYSCRCFWVSVTGLPYGYTIIILKHLLIFLNACHTFINRYFITFSSVPHFIFFCLWDQNWYTTEPLWVFNEIMHAKYLIQCPTQNKFSINLRSTNAAVPVSFYSYISYFFASCNFQRVSKCVAVFYWWKW
jgi:hypothetical protein